MANEKATEDLDLGEEKKRNSKLIIIIAVVALLFVGVGAGGYFLLSNGEEADQEVAAAPEDEAVPEAAVAQGEVDYMALNPPFVVTLSGKPSLLQVGVSVRVSNDQIGEIVSHNDPMIRHNLLNLMSTVDADALKTRSGKEALRKQMLYELNRILKELQAPGKADGLYFTSFVMQ